MKALIEQTEVATNSIGPPAMNYGQHQRWPIDQQRQYQLVLSKNEFVNKIGPCFENSRQGEMNDDYDEEDRSDFPQLFAWRELGYPSFRELLHNDTALLEQLLKYWEYDISHALSEFSGKSRQVFYSVNSIDEVVFDGDCVTVKGIAYEQNR